ncbi:hypothetical protein C8D87_11614 [Lentzea atacamensis]|uniref:SpoVT-AbrB domain-containing protein n=1 Tax=Lentzea atacamensis TaxID=531938 RepID=A0ABX9DXB2_9PSEU|nr:hypothetical protein [Lentzea atacamensis]RAS58961.1 hypothetical protein C8D87_11614 [Lentzea atacamensis]
MNLVDAIAEKLTANPAGREMRSPRIAGLPVPRPPERVQRSSSRYAFTTIDDRGRLGDRSLIRLLNWRPGTSLKPTVLDGQVIVLSRSAGTAMVTKLGHVRIPAAIRHLCQLRAGDGLLLATSAAHDLLIVCTTSVLDQALVAHARGEAS